jgi:hypothetical protein
MSFIIGKITRKVSKQHNEYFVGKICGLPVRGSWAKKGQDDLCLFLDSGKINFLSEQNEAGSKTEPQEENK